MKLIVVRDVFPLYTSNVWIDITGMHNTYTIRKRDYYDFYFELEQNAFCNIYFYNVFLWWVAQRLESTDTEFTRVVMFRDFAQDVVDPTSSPLY